MKLLTTSDQIEGEFKRLMNSYSEFYWLSAWAGVGFSCYEMLKNKKNKICKIIIGTSFNHTHPEFIREFNNNKNVKFAIDLDEVFHPKLYLFQNGGKEWEMLVGSMNFTSAGFYGNAESLILINSEEDTDKRVYQNARKLIDKSWEQARHFSEKEISEYELGFHNRERLEGRPGGRRQTKPAFTVKAMNMGWEEFVNKVKREEERSEHSTKERLEVLDKAKEAFRKFKHFEKMDTIMRKKIAGTIPSSKIDDGLEWHYFGHLMPRGYFKRAVINNNKNVSLALDCIPLEGEVTKAHYERFLEHFKMAFRESDELAGGTRLLMMKRPDVFVCLNNANKEDLCKDFGIKQSNMDYKRYWNDIIENITSSMCKWWNSPKPKNEIDAEIWEGRSAFLDAIYYEY